MWVVTSLKNSAAEDWSLEKNMHKNLFRPLIFYKLKTFKSIFNLWDRGDGGRELFLLAQNLFTVDLPLGNCPSPLSVHVVSAKLTWVVMELRLASQNINTSLPPILNSDAVKRWVCDQTRPILGSGACSLGRGCCEGNSGHLAGST